MLGRPFPHQAKRVSIPHVSPLVYPSIPPARTSPFHPSSTPVRGIVSALGGPTHPNCSIMAVCIGAEAKRRVVFLKPRPHEDSQRPSPRCNGSAPVVREPCGPGAFSHKAHNSCGDGTRSSTRRKGGGICPSTSGQRPLTFGKGDIDSAEECKAGPCRHLPCLPVARVEDDDAPPGLLRGVAKVSGRGVQGGGHRAHWQEQQGYSQTARSKSLRCQAKASRLRHKQHLRNPTSKPLVGLDAKLRVICIYSPAATLKGCVLKTFPWQVRHREIFSQVMRDRQQQAC